MAPTECLLSAFVLDCFLARLPAHLLCLPSSLLLACLLACLLPYLLACSLVCSLACLLAYLLACWHACWPGCLPACFLACLLTCLLACLLACLLSGPLLKLSRASFQCSFAKRDGHTDARTLKIPSSRAPVGAKND